MHILTQAKAADLGLWNRTDEKRVAVFRFIYQSSC